MKAGVYCENNVDWTMGGVNIMPIRGNKQKPTTLMLQTKVETSLHDMSLTLLHATPTDLIGA